MANEEHLALLKQGVGLWNRWREEHPNILPDLSRANLSRTNLGRASLRGTFLSKTDLRGADLRDAVLSGANLSKARMLRTVLNHLDLAQVKGLESVLHFGSSDIGIVTIYLSQGQIPEVFLRGAGVPENFIEYMRSLTGQAFVYYSCFISHSSQDKDFCQRLYNDLQAAGVRCWLASEDLKIGDRFWERIDESIRLHDKLLIVLSEHSVERAWVRREVLSALEKEDQSPGTTVLFPVRLDETVMTTRQPWAADLRRERHIGDFTRWKDHDAYQRALRPPAARPPVRDCISCLQRRRVFRRDNSPASVLALQANAAPHSRCCAACLAHAVCAPCAAVSRPAITRSTSSSSTSSVWPSSSVGICWRRTTLHTCQYETPSASAAPCSV